MSFEENKVQINPKGELYDVRIGVLRHHLRFYHNYKGKVSITLHIN